MTDLRVCQPWWPLGWQDRGLVTVRMLYLIFVRLAAGRLDGAAGAFGGVEGRGTSSRSGYWPANQQDDKATRLARPVARSQLSQRATFQVDVTGLHAGDVTCRPPPPIHAVHEAARGKLIELCWWPRRATRPGGRSPRCRRPAPRGGCRGDARCRSPRLAAPPGA